jgi:hypothetical protein
MKTVNARIKKIILASLILTAGFSYGAGYGLLEDELLPVEVSSLGPTRITIQGEKITDVFVYPEDSARTTLHPAGFALIIPNLDSGAPAYITLIGDGGSMQDLKLSFVKKQPSPIKLVKSQVAQASAINVISNLHNTEVKKETLVMSGINFEDLKDSNLTTKKRGKKKCQQ